MLPALIQKPPLSIIFKGRIKLFELAGLKKRAYSTQRATLAKANDNQ